MKSRILAPLAALFLVVATPALAQKSAGDVVDDSAITTSVNSKLLASKEAPGGAINVETYKAVVLLSGFVETEEQKAAAERIAKEASNVKEVRNKILVHSKTSMGTKFDDTMLTSKAKTALMGADGVVSGQIDVESKGGIVQLSGFVSSENMRDLALAAVKKVEGVKEVDDAMFVKPAG